MPERDLRSLRRAQIVDAARDLVAEGGLAALTFGALESRLSFTRGVVTYHFENKDEIVFAVLESAVAEIDAATRARVERSESLAEKVHAAVGGMVEGFLGHDEATAILVAFWGRLRSDERAAEANAALYRAWRANARRLVDAALEARGECAIDSDALAAVMVGLVLGIVCQAYFEPGSVDVAAAVREGGESLVARLSAR